MICRTFADRVDELIDGLVPAAEAAELREHAATCTACTADIARAEKFRTMLASSGRDALAVAASRQAAVRARDAAAAAAAGHAPKGVLRRLRLPAAAAALVLAGLALGRLGAGTPAGDAQVASGTVEIARGERFLLGPGRLAVADVAARLTVLPDSDGARVRLDAGEALFQVEHGRTFEVETDLGTAEVRGTLFHVARRADRSVSVAVMSGVVVFRPARGGATRTLRERTILDVAPDGAQRVLSASEHADLLLRTEMMGLEIDALRGDLERKDEELAALRAAAAAAPAAAPAVAADRTPWRDLGASAWKLMGRRPDDKDGRAPNFEAFNLFLAHSKELTAATGTANPWDWPLHPVVIARSAPGFIDALAPGATEDARGRAAAGIGRAADEFAAATPPTALPSEVLQARLRMLAAIVVTIRDELGVGAAAEFGRALQRGMEGAPIRVATGDNSARDEFVAHWGRQLDLTDAQRAELASLIERRIAATRSVQQSILARMGDAAGRAFLFPTWWMPKPPANGSAPAPAPAPAPAVDDAQSVADELARIQAKSDLLGPRLELERAFRVFLTPEQLSRGMPQSSVITYKD